MPRQSLTDTRDVLRDYDFSAGSLHLRAHGCPDPDRAIVRTRRPRKGAEGKNTVRPTKPTPVSQRTLVQQHTLAVAIAEQAMFDAQHAVADARKAGDWEAREIAALYAREARATYLKLTNDAPERRTIEVDQGSAVNPMVAV